MRNKTTDFSTSVKVFPKQDCKGSSQDKGAFSNSSPWHLKYLGTKISQKLLQDRLNDDLKSDFSYI